MEREKFRDFHKKEFYNEILFKSENFVAIPSLGSMIEGWLLIVPKKHQLSLQCINSDFLLRELEDFSNSISKIMVQEFGYVTMFEHGAADSNSTVGCGVDFAHLHLVPVNFDLINGLEEFLEIKYDWKKVSGIKNFISSSEKGIEYLFLTDYLGNSFVSQNERIPSQLFRKVIAQMVT